jgi:hypothetical protein
MYIPRLATVYKETHTLSHHTRQEKELVVVQVFHEDFLAYYCHLNSELSAQRDFHKAEV